MLPYDVMKLFSKKKKEGSPGKDTTTTKTLFSNLTEMRFIPGFRNSTPKIGMALFYLIILSAPKPIKKP